jgi:hypothetical protein
VAELINAGHARRVQGTRLDPDLLGSEGLVVVTASDLDQPASIGRTASTNSRSQPSTLPRS